MKINDLKGVGPKTLVNLEKLNIFSVENLLEYYPFRYQIYNLISIDEAEENVDVTISGIVEAEPKVFFIKRNLNRLTFRLQTDNKVINVAIFNRNFLKQHLHVGRKIILYGKYDPKKNSFTASDIKFDKIDDVLIEPKYHLVNGISNKDLIRLISNAMGIGINLEDYIPDILNDKYKLLDKNTSVLNIHKPQDMDVLKKSKLKLIYEELFLFLFKIQYLKKFNKKAKGIERDTKWSDVESFISGLAFELTGDQLKAAKEIFSDLNDSKRMNRLLLGDVGSGKTIVSVVALYQNFLSGYQGALMAPTEILATQHYYSIKDILDRFNIVAELLVGSMTKKEKNKIVERLLSGDVDVVIGTHAILSDYVEFKSLGLVITDEQHRFGVNQRSNLQNKGRYPDVLYMSATPIPRTYALTIYGDMDTSLLKEKPSGRKDIKTVVKKESELKDVLFKMLDEIKQGHQIYVVAPTIEEGELDLHDVNELKVKFDTAFNNKINIQVLHGKVKQNEKDAIMNDFKNGTINVLISTTVIEVGIDVKNATMMVIFDADRFGLATLHQLRGRVGRSDLESFCYLICDKDIERLKVLEESNDGFYISEKDFELRGEGDLFGERQSGDMVFKIANIKRDFKIMLKVKEDIEECFDEIFNDPKYENIISELKFID